MEVSRTEHRIPRCPECGALMVPEPYGWWACRAHPWRMAPDVNHPDYDELVGSPPGEPSDPRAAPVIRSTRP